MNEQVTKPALQPHEVRVVVEKNELDEKAKKLWAFLSTPVAQELPAMDRELLERQYDVMAQYSTILAERITRF